MEKTKKHILFLCGWYPSDVFPSNGDFIKRHAEAVSLRHNVSILHIVTDPKISKNIIIEEKNTDRLKTYIAYIKPSKSPIIKLYLFFHSFKKILKAIGDFDLIHLNILYPFGLFALYLKFFKKKNFIITEHWSGYQHPLHLKIKIHQRYFSRLIAKHAKCICPVSKHLTQEMLNFKLKGVYKNVPNVVDIDVFKPIEHKNYAPIFVHISGLDDHIKNISGILNTLKKLNEQKFDFTFYFIGGSPYFQEKQPENIKFIDFLPHHQLVEYLQKADALIMFSYYENLPCVILESFACGVPVISTNVGGISEYFPDDFGVLINNKDEKKLTSILLNFDRKQFADKTKMYQYAKTYFSQQIIADTFSEIYNLALN